MIPQFPQPTSYRMDDATLDANYSNAIDHYLWMNYRYQPNGPDDFYLVNYKDEPHPTLVWNLRAFPPPLRKELLAYKLEDVNATLQRTRLRYHCSDFASYMLITQLGLSDDKVLALFNEWWKE